MPDLPGVQPSKADRSSAGKTRLLTLHDLDGRTSAAQMAYALRDAIAADLGGLDSLSALKRELVNSVAIMSAIVTDANARWLRGEPVSLAEIATLSNARRRDAQLLGLERTSHRGVRHDRPDQARFDP
ncbi:hypothetical protein RHECIAT_CH0003833 [Rhizobium etli CIAT 652]|uniref:Uncharacterized protein n=1 Tax=Rhizobium etli (strain CIAT 652) TaxID=491916 RepID=B3PZX1_RHIE6|nr:hypothetical protein RHECIAT_CH0003833 [Rhizobium etli CIAT 652]